MISNTSLETKGAPTNNGGLNNKSAKTMKSSQEGRVMSINSTTGLGKTQNYQQRKNKAMSTFLGLYIPPSVLFSLIRLIFKCATHWKITDFYVSTVFFKNSSVLAHDDQFFPPCFLFLALLRSYSLLNVLS